MPPAVAVPGLQRPADLQRGARMAERYVRAPLVSAASFVRSIDRRSYSFGEVALSFRRGSSRILLMGEIKSSHGHGH